MHNPLKLTKLHISQKNQEFTLILIGFWVWIELATVFAMWMFICNNLLKEYYHFCFVICMVELKTHHSMLGDFIHTITDRRKHIFFCCSIWIVVDIIRLWNICKFIFKCWYSEFYGIWIASYRKISPAGNMYFLTSFRGHVYYLECSKTFLEICIRSHSTDTIVCYF